MAYGSILGQTTPTPTTANIPVTSSISSLFNLDNAVVIDNILSILSKSILVNEEGNAGVNVDGENLFDLPINIGVPMKAITGTYVGTGNANTPIITFNFEPKIVLISFKTSSSELFSILAPTLGAGFLIYYYNGETASGYFYEDISMGMTLCNLSSNNALTISPCSLFEFSTNGNSVDSVYMRDLLYASNRSYNYIGIGW